MMRIIIYYNNNNSSSNHTQAAMQTGAQSTWVPAPVPACAPVPPHACLPARRPACTIIAPWTNNTV